MTPKSHWLPAPDGAYLAGPIHHFAVVASTMDEARRLALAGAQEGTVVIADEQTQGRGRLGRRWSAPAEQGLLFTMVFRPPSTVALARVPMAVALGTLDALDGLEVVDATRGASVGLGLKWPNDFMAWPSKLASDATPSPELKLGGMLAEVVPGASGSSSALLVGVGLNLGQRAGDLPPGATSLAELGITPLDRPTLLRDILAKVDGHYAALLAGEDPVARWSSRLVTLGRRVRVIADEGPLTGEAIGVEPDGALRVRGPGGKVHVVRAGDVGIA